MMKVFPKRTYDVGIAEQHAVTFSAGLATQGIIPFCNIYSTFLQRAYDQVIHDVAIQNLHVVFCLDRGGLVGADGATHHGVFDIAYLRCIPNLIVSAPMHEHNLRDIMYTAQKTNTGPFAIRYPRGKGVKIDWKSTLKEVKIGKAEKINEGTEVAILSIGHPGNFIVEAQEQFNKLSISVAHWNMIFIKPLDTKVLDNVFKKYDKVITIEDGCLQGGFGSAIIEYMSDNGYNSKVKRLGIKDNFVNHGSQDELYRDCGIDVQAVVEAVKELVNNQSISQVG
jgi:1-deoxy-D-xylulose-5-phosphate synthase